MSTEDQQCDRPACSLVDYQREDSQTEEKLEVVEVAEEVEEKVRDAEELVVEDVTTEKEEDKLPASEEKVDDKVSSNAEGSKTPQSPAEVEEATGSR